MATALLNLLFIFVLRVMDVSLGTLRVNMMVRGYRYLAAGLGFVECLIWLVAAVRVLNEITDIWQMVAFAAGFATGTLVGVALNDMLALGKTLMRVMVPQGGAEVADELRSMGFVVTTIGAAGRDGGVQMSFTVMPKKKARKALAVVQKIAPQAFVTFEDVSRAESAYVPAPAPARRSWLPARPRV